MIGLTLDVVKDANAQKWSRSYRYRAGLLLLQLPFPPIDAVGEKAGTHASRNAIGTAYAASIAVADVAEDAVIFEGG